MRFKYLNHGSLACDFKDLTLLHGTVTQTHVNDFGVSGLESLIYMEKKKRKDFGNLTLSRTTKGPSTLMTVR